jgi:hypothetical protein
MRTLGLRYTMLSRDRARCISEHLLAASELRGSRFPPPAQSVGEHLRRRWCVIPHGDRRDGAQSRGVEHNEVAAIERQDDVVRVLVLCDDLAHLPNGLLLPCPREYLSECVASGEGCRRALNETLGD